MLRLERRPNSVNTFVPLLPGFRLVKWRTGSPVWPLHLHPARLRRRAPTRRPRHRYKPIELRQEALDRARVAGGVLARRHSGRLGRDCAPACAHRRTPAAITSTRFLCSARRQMRTAILRPRQLARVTEAVREYERGVAPRLLFTGGPAHNQFVEADVMAGAAAAQGIPPSAIFVETKATDTIQNACYSARIMQAHGWHSAEIVSSAYHLPRAGMIFSHTPLDWRLHAAPPLQPGASDSEDRFGARNPEDDALPGLRQLGGALRALRQTSE